jgi:lysyl-tRNA synthetase class 2
VTGSSRTPLWWRVPAGAGTAFAAILTLSSSLSPNVQSRERLLEGFEPATAQAAAHAAGVAGAIVLLALSWGVMRGRRRASHAAVAVLGVLAGVHAVKGLDYEEALIGISLAIVLHLGMRAAARGTAPGRAALAGLFVLVAVSAAYATTVTILLVSGRSPGVGPALDRAASGLVGGALPLPPTARTCVHVLIGIAVVALVLWLRALLAPALAQDGHDDAEHERAAAIVAEHGDDSIAPFVLRADKAFFFARGGVLAYRTLRETAVVSGDPVGPPGAAPAILDAFLALATKRGWDVVVTGAGEAHLEGYRALGLRTMRIGTEAVVDPAALSLGGRRHRSLRKAVGRVERRGWTVRVVAATELDRGLQEEVLAVERAWRASQRRLLGFAMAMDRLWGAAEDARDVYVLARNPEGELRAFQRYVSYCGGLSLDAMRRLDDDPNGISETLVVAALDHAREQGLAEVSLNFSGFAHLMVADALAGRGARLGRWALRRLQGHFQLERLARFNAKFDPLPRPRHLVYTGRTRLPLAALRVMQAEAYVRAPRSRPRRGAWQPRRHPVASGTMV